MNAFQALLMTEFRLQKRAGFLFVIGIVTCLWLIILTFIPDTHLRHLLGLVLSLDISSVALLSCIGLHLLDIRLKVVNALLVAPVNILLKLWVRVGVTALLAALTGLIVSLPHVASADYAMLFFICLLNSLLYGVAGSLLAAYQPSISGIFVSMGLATPVWLAAYLPYLGLYSHDLLMLLPTYGATQMFVYESHYRISWVNFLSWSVWFALLSAWLYIKYRPLVARS